MPEAVGASAGPTSVAPGATSAPAATIRGMDDRASARRELALLATAVIALSRFAEPPLVVLVALGLGAGVALGSLWVLGEDEPRGVAVEALILPALAAVAGLLALRLVPLGPLLVLVVPPAYLLVLASLKLEARLEARPTLAGPDETTPVLGLATLVAFLGFAGIAALAGASDATAPSDGSAGMDWAVTISVLADAALAFLIGYRLTALRTTDVRRVLPAAGTYAAAVAVAAGGLALLELPGLVAPAVLALVLFLWDAIRAASAGGVRDIRSIWQIALLAVLGLLVVVLNLRQVG